MTKESDWVGKWFELQEENGERTEIVFGKVRDGLPQPEWTAVPHVTHDGIGALARLMLENGQAVSPPASSYSRKDFVPIAGFDPSLAELAIQPSARWASQERNGGPTSENPCRSPTRSWRLLSSELSRGIVSRARELRVSVNSLALSSANRVIAGHLDGASEPMIWQVPINLRGAVRLEAETANQFCAMDLELPELPTAERVDELFIAAIAEERPWYFWKINNIARQLGEAQGLAMMREILQWREEKGIFRVGLLSNLGLWKSQDPVPSGFSGWLVGAPVTYVCPFSLTLVTSWGRLGMVLQLHSSLERSQKDAEELLETFILNLLN